jgi:hypothetical protein
LFDGRDVSCYVNAVAQEMVGVGASAADMAKNLMLSKVCADG